MPWQNACAESLQPFHEFNIDDGFVSGINTLQFVVSNASLSPAGLRVTLTGSAEQNVPDPATLGLLLAGALPLPRRRRRWAA